uniref:Uncharacterized protein n=1 Tax=Rhizophora mucronata TaxID=61149 RepID=A0A2P2NF41_RHIMU
MERNLCKDGRFMITPFYTWWPGEFEDKNNFRQDFGMGLHLRP